MRNQLLSLFVVALPMLAVAGPVDINHADAPTLAAELNGVGLSRAQAIVEYRQLNGDFTAQEQLLEVKGIGSQVLEANRQNIQIADAK